jgi:aminoglycoside phosphotransferase
MTAVDEERRQEWLAEQIAVAMSVPDGAMCLAGGIPVDPESLSRTLGSALAELHALPFDEFPFPARGMDVLLSEARTRANAGPATATDGPYRGIAPGRLLEILEEQMAGLSDDRLVLVHGALTAADVWFHPETGLALTSWAESGAGDRHLDLAMGAKLLGDTYGYAVAGPFFEAYGHDDVEALRLDAFQLLVHLLTS